MYKKKHFIKLLFLLSFITLTGSAMSGENKNNITEKITIEKNIVFFKSDQYTLHLDIYKPAKKNKKKLKPIIWLHGGEFLPHVDKEQDYIVRFCKYFAEKGYFCIAPDYRTTEDPFIDWEKTKSNTVDDTLHAIEWIDKNKRKYSLDTDYLTVAGGSAGGMISIYASAKYSFLKKKPLIFANINLWGSPFDYINFLSEKYPPTLIVHGTDDQSVPYKNSIAFSEKLNKLSVYNEIMTIKGEDHTPVSHFDDIVLRIEAFLKKLEK